MGKSKKNYDEAGAAVERGNNAARRRAKEYKDDLRAKQPVMTESLRPKERPADLGKKRTKGYAEGGRIEGRGMKSCQMSGRNGSKTY